MILKPRLRADLPTTHLQATMISSCMQHDTHSTHEIKFLNTYFGRRDAVIEKSALTKVIKRNLDKWTGRLIPTHLLRI